MNELSIPKKAVYKDIVELFRVALQSLETNAIQQHWEIGSLVVKFQADVQNTNGRYPEGTNLETLAADLQKDGGLLGIQNPIRALYHARAIYDAYTPEKLAEAIGKKFTLTHLKALVSLPSEDIAAAEAKMVTPEGEVLSTREAQDVVREIKKDAEAKAEAKYAAEEMKEGKTPPPAKKSDAKVSPYKAIKQIMKGLDLVTANASEAHIAMAQVSKEGFDGEQAQKNWKTALADLKAAIMSVQPLLPELANVAASQE